MLGQCLMHGLDQCLPLQAQRWISPWSLLKRPSNLPLMTFSVINWAEMGERYGLECMKMLCSSTFWFWIPASASHEAGWRSSGRCWPVVVQECAKSSSPHPWRCSRSSCRMLADLVIIKLIKKKNWAYFCHWKWQCVVFVKSCPAEGGAQCCNNAEDGWNQRRSQSFVQHQPSV